MSHKKTTEEFIQESKVIHGDLYDYSRVDYQSSKKKVIIGCKVHGWFEQAPEKHIIGHGCPQCAKNCKSNLESFIEKASSLHLKKYDYSEFVYVNNSTKSTIICPIHGKFEQTPHNHLAKQGCPQCGNEKMKGSKLTQEEFISKCLLSHKKETYDYSKTIYKGTTQKITIICPKHGEFEQNAWYHLKGGRCPVCAHEEQGLDKRKNTEEFIVKAREKHGMLYDYSKVEYKTAKEKVCIICPQHGEFWQSPWHHLNGNGCPKCVHHISMAEQEIYDFVCSLVGKENVIQSERSILGNGKEIDIYVPKFKIGIEYHGLYWHSEEQGKSPSYHLEKLKACKENGIKLIQIFEDEYRDKKAIVQNKIMHLLKSSQMLNKIMGRKCIIRLIEREEAKSFLEKFHIQGFALSSVYLGAIYDNKLIGVMSFTLNSGVWELSRFASDYNYICQGVGGKLFKHFVANYNPQKIKSFADRRWTLDEENNLYLQLGFNFERYTLPDYKYVDLKKSSPRMHKFGFRKQPLSRKYGFPLTMTEREMTTKLGLIRVFDCGLIKYVWEKES